MLLTETEKALAGLIVMSGFVVGLPVHVPVEILDVVEQHGELKIETDEDGCYNVTLELESVDGR